MRTSPAQRPFLVFYLSTPSLVYHHSDPIPLHVCLRRRPLNCGSVLRTCRYTGINYLPSTSSRISRSHLYMDISPLSGYSKLPISGSPLSSRIIFLLISLIYNISHHSTLTAYPTVVATDVRSTSSAATIPCPDSPVPSFLPSFP